MDRREHLTLDIKTFAELAVGEEVARRWIEVCVGELADLSLEELARWRRRLSGLAPGVRAHWINGQLEDAAAREQDWQARAEELERERDALRDKLRRLEARLMVAQAALRKARATDGGQGELL